MSKVRFEVMKLGGVRTQEGLSLPVIGETLAEGEVDPTNSTADIYTNSGNETVAVLVRTIGQQIYVRRGRGTLSAASALPEPATPDDVRHWIRADGDAFLYVAPGQKLAIVNANLV